MRNIARIPIVFALIVAGSLSISRIPVLAQREQKESLKSFEGIYLGFSPTDESDVIMGEIEITIKGADIKIRMATGLMIQTEKMGVADFVQMTAQEVKEIFKDGSEYPARTVGFKAREKSGFPKLLFLKNSAENEFGLIVRTGGMGEMLGPTLLYSPSQVARGDYEKTVQGIEQKAGKGVLPRLRNGGKAEKH